MGTVIKWLLLIVVLGVIAYVGLTVYSNFIDKGRSGTDMGEPDKAEASYSIYVENTGELYYSDDVEQHGTTQGNRLYVLSGYWQNAGREFVYRSDVAYLDENIFGTITVRRRN